MTYTAGSERQYWCAAEFLKEQRFSGARKSTELSSEHCGPKLSFSFLALEFLFQPTHIRMDAPWCLQIS